MALSTGINGRQDLGANQLASQHHKEHQLPDVRGQQQEALKKDGGIGDVFWSRPESRLWTTMLLLGTCLLYCARVLMPICVVTMSSHFDWDKKQSGIVLSSFFWGYCLTQIVGGHLSDRIGGEKVLLLSASAWGSITAITPLLISSSSAHLTLMTFTRFLMGLLQGVYFPALASLLSQKVQESERALTYSTVGTGSQFGTLVMGAAGSLLLDWYGWESVFYLSGLLTLLWVYCMCKFILPQKEIIVSLHDLAKGLSLSSKPTKVPWRKIFRKPPVWAVIVAQLCAASTFFTLLSWLPTFFSETFPDSKGWIFNVIPWLVAIPFSLFAGFLSDQCISQGCKPITARHWLWGIQSFCLRDRLLHQLLPSSSLRLSQYRTSNFQPQWHLSQYPGSDSFMCWFIVRCGKYRWSFTRCHLCVRSWTPRRKHWLLGLRFQSRGHCEYCWTLHVPHLWKSSQDGPGSSLHRFINPPTDLEGSVKILEWRM